MAEKKEEKAAEKSSGKMILFNHSKNPFSLKPGPNGEKRIFAVGTSMEFTDAAEYEQLRKYKGMGTTAQVSPDLGHYIVQLEGQVKEARDERDEARRQLEKYQSKKG